VKLLHHEIQLQADEVTTRNLLMLP